MKNDLICRQAAIEVLLTAAHINLSDGQAYFLEKALNEIPSAQPERKRGRWKRHNTYRGDDTSGYVDPDWRCSECGKRANINECFMYDLTDFCPNCGADMREG